MGSVDFKVGLYTGKLMPVRDGEFWGYVNAQGEVAVPPRFSRVKPFSEGLAPVREDDCFGYIDERGAFVIAPQFDNAYPFREGLARVLDRGACSQR